VGRVAVVRAAREPLLVGGLTLAATAYVAAVDPNRPGHYLVCPLLTLTGLYCPACGGLRAVHDLTHLDLARAWSMNPLLVLVAPFAVLAWGRWLARACGSSRWQVTPASSRRSSWLAAAALVVVLAYAVLRNLPWLAPWLAP
jgi:hypothetical protein